MQRIIAAALLVVMVRAGAQSVPDPFLGRWALDMAASHYEAGACPKRMTIEMTREARGVHYQSETLQSDGEIRRVEYVADYDGKPAVVTGERGILLPVSLRQESPKHVIATYTNASQVVATSDRTLSDDDRTLTITTKSRDALGQLRTNVGVYRRVGE
jgi:hypothetical protein